MKKEYLHFDSRDNQTVLHAVKYTPDDGEVRAVLQIVHGMAEYVERYEEFAEYMTQKGYAVVGEDHLGHGKSVPEGGLYGYFCKQDPATVLVRDVHRLKKMMQNLYPEKPYFILGHSMGSFIVRNYLCRYGSGIHGAVIMGTGMASPLSVKSARLLAGVSGALLGDRHQAKWINKMAFGNYNKTYPVVETGAEWLSRDGKRVGIYRDDPLCGFTFTANGFHTLFDLISRLYDKENLEKMPSGLPILMVSGTGDPVGEYGKGVRRAYDSLLAVGMEKVTLKLYPEARHELLNETNRDEVMEDIFLWLEEMRKALQSR